MLRPQGLRGEALCQILTEFPERFTRTAHVFLGTPPREYRVRRAQVEGNHVLLDLEGVNSPEAVEPLRGLEVMIPRAEAEPLPPGRYYWQDVVGLWIQDEAGEILGQLVEILETGANDVYVVHGDTGELLLPAIRQVVLSLDPAAGVMTVRLLPGMQAERRRR